MWGAVGELVGALAVVASLVYVGRQVRHSAAVARVEAVDALTAKLIDVSLLVASDPAIASLVARVQYGGATYQDLTVPERVQVGYIYYGMLQHLLGLWERYTAGLMTREELDRIFTRNSGFFSAPYLCSIWHDLRGNFPDDYAEYVERRYNLPPVV